MTLGGKQEIMQDNTQLEVVDPLNGLGWLCMNEKTIQFFLELNDLCNPLTCGSASVSWVERLRHPNMTRESRVAHRCEWYSHHAWKHELRIGKTWVNETSNQIQFLYVCESLISRWCSLKVFQKLVDHYSLLRFTQIDRP